MSSMTKRDKTQYFKLTAFSAAIMVANHSLSAHAQDDDEAPLTHYGAPVVVKEVVVTGMRSALQKSIDDKRNAQQIIDTINAEDMGKNTDQNIADSLGRVTGVSIVTRHGEGSQVTVRGASANQNNISLNGQQLTSTDFNQAVDLSSYSTDILSKLEVVKTPSADHDEGSLGASINLVTVRPLDHGKDIRSVTLQGRYSDYNKEANHKLQISLSDTFFDETLGLAVTLFDESNTTRRDQYRVENFSASREIDNARDQDGDIIVGVKAIEHTQTIYEQIKNTNDRQGVTLGIQWAPTEETEVMFNGTYTNQKETAARNGFLTRLTNRNNFVEGVAAINSRPNAPFTDPQEDWYTINTQTNTFTKRIDRFGIGDVLSSRGGDDRENLSAAFDITHDINHSFRVAAKVGYSKSTSETRPNAFAIMQNFREVPLGLLFDAGRDIQPVGYDCTSGKCNLVFGSDFVDTGAQLDDMGITLGSDDNAVLTGYNPQDIDSQNLSFLSENDIEIEDELKNVQIDFDWDVDAFGLTTLEFGGKFTQRQKFVDHQTFLFNSITREQVFADDGELPVASRGGPLSDIRGSFVAIGGLEYDDFMDSLDYRAPASNKWIPFDGLAAKNLVLDDENTIRTPDNSRTRNTDIDTSALYLKAKFSFFEDRLAGDFGVRYVETDVKATGFGGVDFWQDGDTLHRDYDLVKLRELRDTSLPICIGAGDTAIIERGYEERFQRIDGTGFDTSSGPDPSGWTPLEAQPSCHDPDYAAYAEFQRGLAPNPGVPITWYTMWRYADISTLRDANYSSDPNRVASDFIAYNADVDIDDAGAFSFIEPINQELKSFDAQNSHSYSNVLPSLNINFAFTNELIGRFSASKTMTRPEIDQLQAGFNITESGYTRGDTPFLSRFQQFNTKLKPLESNNIDISIEWYFNDTGVINAALFFKDMSNFTNVESGQVYTKDLRNLTGSVVADDLILVPEGDATNDYGLGNCQPLRASVDSAFDANNQLAVSDDLRDICAGFNLERVANGDGASIAGLELGYTQAYDFLPGYFLSGLGLSANYTYQDSEYDEERSSIFPDKLLPTYPVADTPEHTYNFTTFWEQDGHQVRLSYRGTSDSLLGADFNTGLQGRTWNQGSLWNDGRDQLDLSATYSFNENVALTFQAVNLLDGAFRTYFTSRELEVLRVEDTGADGGYSFVAFEEGNPLDGNGSKSRTYTEFKTGVSYRLGIRAQF